jgi:branched-chain amino acid transport system permease protein
MFETLAVQILNGVTYGALLFLFASGFTFIFGLMRVVNMAHGAFYLLGAYVGLTVYGLTKNWILAIAGALVVIGLLAGLIQVTMLRRIQGEDMREALLTLGLGMIITDLVLAIWGGMPQFIPAPSAIAQPLVFGEITYPSFRLFVLGIAIVEGLGFWFLLNKTQIGRIIRAGVDDRNMVSALGININRVFTLVFILGGLLVGFSGAIGGSYFAFSQGTEFTVLTYALVVVIMGGMGSVAGSALGALIVGLLDSFGKTYALPFTMLIIFGSLMLVLAFRPQGLLGRER